MSTDVLTGTLTEKPPSANKLYSVNQFGREFLTKAGRAYRNSVREALRGQWALTSFQLRLDDAYDIDFWFFLPDVFNATWGEKKGAERRFKTRDVTNLVKVLEDVLKELLGVDDANACEVHLHKRPSETTEIRVIVRRLDEEELLCMLPPEQQSRFVLR